MKRDVFRPLFLAMALGSMIATGACAGSKTATMLDARLGKMTYGEAVQHFGQPMSCTDSGNETQCTWIRWQGSRHQSDMGVFPTISSHYPPVALLTFKDGVLQGWELSGKWR